MDKTKRTILIAGGAGFVGSHLCEFYLNNGDNVDCLDNYSTGRKENISHLIDNPDFNLIEADITENLNLDKKYDIVVNLASPASPVWYTKLAVETLEAGSVGTKNLLDIAKESDAVFFHASTSEVYGDPEVHPQPETYKGSVNSYGPRSMYDESKRYAEALIYVYREKYNVKTCVARFFNTYGPRMDINDGRVVSNFIVQALRNEPLTIYGDGSQTRSFCYVDDLVRGIVAMIDKQAEGPINLGNPEEYTIKEFADVILKLTGSSSELTNLPLPGDDPLQRKPDISKAKQELNWQPETAVEDGINKTIEYFKSVV